MAAVDDFVCVKWTSYIKKKKKKISWRILEWCNMPKLMSSELKCSVDPELEHWASISISTGEEDQMWCEKTVLSMWEWLLSLSSLLLWSNHHQRVLLMLSTIFKNLIFVYKSLYILDSLVICTPYSLQPLDCTSDNSRHIFIQLLFQFLPAMHVKTRPQSKSIL